MLDEPVASLRSAKKEKLSLSLSAPFEKRTRKDVGWCRAERAESFARLLHSLLRASVIAHIQRLCGSCRLELSLRLQRPARRVADQKSNHGVYGVKSYFLYAASVRATEGSASMHSHNLRPLPTPPG